MKRKVYLICFLSFLSFVSALMPHTGKAQDSLKRAFLEPANFPDKSRIRMVAVGYGSAYLLTLAGLNQLWYADFDRSKFHFFNDNKEWLQADKIGHAASTYYSTWGEIQILKWAGVPKKKAIWLGATGGMLFLTTVEVFDGFSEAWGFSGGDMIANVSGTALAVVQEALWEDQKFKLKFSYRPTDFAAYRPEVLGSNWGERILKDYNGQTYWLSTSVNTFLGKNSKLPDWVNLAFGYSGEGLLGGFSNPVFDVDGEPLPEFKRYRQYFLSLDLDITRIKTKSRFLNSALFTIGYIKIPFPSLEYSRESGFGFNLLGG